MKSGLSRRHKVMFYLAPLVLIAGLFAAHLLGAVGETPLRRLDHGSLIFQSTGHPSGKSYVNTVAIKDRVFVKRGLTLLGLVEAARPVRLAHVDTCQPDAPVRDEVPSTIRFKDVIDSTEQAFGAYAIVAHDSIHCGRDANLERLFEGLGLEEWRQVGFREPYVAMMPAEGRAQEYRAGREEVLALAGKPRMGPASPIEQSRYDALPRVAHAGGGFEGRTYTNAIAALNHNREDYEVFEIDFSWTSDNELVCLHDWNHHFEQAFGRVTESKVSLSTFEALAREAGPAAPCTLESLAGWMRAHPGKRVITDVKERNVEALTLLADRYPDLQQRFIPQVYQPGGYFAARERGFSRIIWTLYRYPGTIEDVLALLPMMDLYGLTMTERHANEGLAKQVFRARGVLSWVHTINDPERLEAYSKLGVANVYTDWLRE